jgi:hypothetical protein
MLPRKTSMLRPKPDAKIISSTAVPEKKSEEEKVRTKRVKPSTPDAAFTTNQAVAGDMMKVQIKRVKDKVVCVATDDYFKEFRLEMDADDVLSRTGAKRIGDVNESQLQVLAPLLDMRIDKVRHLNAPGLSICAAAIAANGTIARGSEEGASCC